MFEAPDRERLKEKPELDLLFRGSQQQGFPKKALSNQSFCHFEIQKGILAGIQYGL